MTVHHAFKTTFCFQFVISGILLAKALVLAPVALGLPAPARSASPLFEVRLESPNRPNLSSSQPCSPAGILTADGSPQAVAELPPPPPATGDVVAEDTVDLLPIPSESMVAAHPLANEPCPIGGPTEPSPERLAPEQLIIRVMPENPACSRSGQVVLLCGPL